MGSKETWKDRFVRWLYGGKVDKPSVIFGIIVLLIGSAILILAYHNYPGPASGTWWQELVWFTGFGFFFAGVAIVWVIVIHRP